MNKNNNNIEYSIFLDESGAMHDKKYRYFIIGGYITKIRTKESKIQKQYEKKLKKKLLFFEENEIKGSNLSIKNKIEYIKIINKNNVETIAIIVDKSEVEFSDKVNENDKYNYFIGLIYKYFLKNNVHRINFYLDSRPTANELRYELEEYLKKLSIDFSFCNKTIIDPPKVEYLDSKFWKNFNIRMADIISNYIWNVSNRNIR